MEDTYAVAGREALRSGVAAFRPQAIHSALDRLAPSSVGIYPHLKALITPLTNVPWNWVPTHREIEFISHHTRELLHGLSDISSETEKLWGRAAAAAQASSSSVLEQSEVTRLVFKTVRLACLWLSLSELILLSQVSLQHLQDIEVHSIFWQERCDAHWAQSKTLSWLLDAWEGGPLEWGQYAYLSLVTSAGEAAAGLKAWWKGMRSASSGSGATQYGAEGAEEKGGKGSRTTAGGGDASQKHHLHGTLPAAKAAREEASAAGLGMFPLHARVHAAHAAIAAEGAALLEQSERQLALQQQVWLVPPNKKVQRLKALEQPLSCMLGLLVRQIAAIHDAGRSSSKLGVALASSIQLLEQCLDPKGHAADVVRRELAGWGRHREKAKAAAGSSFTAPAAASAGTGAVGEESSTAAGAAAATSALSSSIHQALKHVLLLRETGKQLCNLQAGITAAVKPLRSRPAFQRNWFTWLLLASGAVAGAVYVHRHRSEMRLWLRETAAAVQAFYVEHVAEPARGMLTELLSSKRQHVADPAALEDAHRSLRMMLENFNARLLKEGGGGGLSPELMGQDLSKLAAALDMRPVSERYVLEMQNPIKNAAWGNLVEMMLIQIAFIKKELLSAMAAMDEILRENRFNLQVMSTVPAFLVLYGVGNGLSMLVDKATAPPNTGNARDSIRLALLDILRLLNVSRSRLELLLCCSCAGRRRQEQLQEAAALQLQRARSVAAAATLVASGASGAVRPGESVGDHAISSVTTTGAATTTATAAATATGAGGSTETVMATPPRAPHWAPQPSFPAFSLASPAPWQPQPQQQQQQQQQQQERQTGLHARSYGTSFGRYDRQDSFHAGRGGAGQRQQQQQQLCSCAAAGTDSSAGATFCPLMLQEQTERHTAQHIWSLLPPGYIPLPSSSSSLQAAAAAAATAPVPAPSSAAAQLAPSVPHSPAVSRQQSRQGAAGAGVSAAGVGARAGAGAGVGITSAAATSESSITAGVGLHQQHLRRLSWQQLQQDVAHGHAPLPIPEDSSNSEEGAPARTRGSVTISSPAPASFPAGLPPPAPPASACACGSGSGVQLFWGLSAHELGRLSLLLHKLTTLLGHFRTRLSYAEWLRLQADLQDLLEPHFSLKQRRQTAEQMSSLYHIFRPTTPDVLSSWKAAGRSVSHSLAKHLLPGEVPGDRALGGDSDSEDEGEEGLHIGQQRHD